MNPSPSVRPGRRVGHREERAVAVDERRSAAAVDGDSGSSAPALASVAAGGEARPGAPGPGRDREQVAQDRARRRRPAGAGAAERDGPDGLRLDLDPVQDAGRPAERRVGRDPRRDDAGVDRSVVRRRRRLALRCSLTTSPRAARRGDVVGGDAGDPGPAVAGTVGGVGRRDRRRVEPRAEREPGQDRRACSPRRGPRRRRLGSASA